MKMQDHCRPRDRAPISTGPDQNHDQALVPRLALDGGLVDGASAHVNQNRHIRAMPLKASNPATSVVHMIEQRTSSGKTGQEGQYGQIEIMERRKHQPTPPCNIRVKRHLAS